jgi:hypothetical protein
LRAPRGRTGGGPYLAFPPVPLSPGALCGQSCWPRDAFWPIPVPGDETSRTRAAGTAVVMNQVSDRPTGPDRGARRASGPRRDNRENVSAVQPAALLRGRCACDRRTATRARPGSASAGFGAAARCFVTGKTPRSAKRFRRVVDQKNDQAQRTKWATNRARRSRLRLRPCPALWPGRGCAAPG